MQTQLLPNVIDLRIIGACDLRCPFCFGPKHELGPTNSELLLNLIAKLPSYGVQNLVFAGGEPGIVRELPKFLEAAKNHGLHTVMTTNGIRFRDRIDEIAPHLDWVGLPLDGDSPAINQLMRVGHPQHFEIVLDLIPLIRKRYPQLRIKLGTVVCAINKEHVVGLANILKGQYSPDIWKLYQVVYSSYGEHNKGLIELSNEDYEEILQQVEEAALKQGISVAPYRRSGRSGGYLFMEPTGDAMVVVNDKEVIIGNFFVDFEGVVSAWHNFVNTERMNSNFTMTYPNEP